jgi:hypothetical protein
VFAIGRAWPYLVAIVLIIAGAVSGVAAKRVELDVPLLAVVAVVVLAAYPLAKLVESTIRSQARRPFSYGGLSWKPSWWGLGYPTALCPRPACGRRVYYKTEAGISLEPMGPCGWDKVLSRKVAHFYECPMHGRLDVPDIDFRELQEKAKIMESRLGAP